MNSNTGNNEDQNTFKNISRTAVLPDPSPDESGHIQQNFAESIESTFKKEEKTELLGNTEKEVHNLGTGVEVHKVSEQSEMNTDKETDFYEEPCKFPRVNASQAAFRSFLSD